MGHWHWSHEGDPPWMQNLLSLTADQFKNCKYCWDWNWIISFMWVLFKGNFTQYFQLSWDSSVNIVIGCGLDSLGSIPRKGKNFIFHTTSKPALRSTQPSIQWVFGAVSPGVKQLGAWSWPFTSIYYQGQEWWSYTFNPPIHVHGMVLN
jgi:hypothetical protein